MAMSEVGIRVTGTNTSGASINAAKRDVKDLGDEAQKSARRVVELGAAEEVAARGAKKMSTELDEAGDQVSELSKKMALAAATGAVFNAEINRFIKNGRFISEKTLTSGGGGNGKSPLSGLVKDSEKVGKEVAGTFASAFEGGLMGTFKALPPEAKAALGAAVGGAAIAATPFIVSAVNGAILGGIGAGGLAVGIAMQAKDPVVAGAFKGLGGHIMADLGEATTPFKGQLLGVVDDFGRSWAKIKPNVSGFFSTLAPEVGELGKAISKGVEILGPSLEKAAGPAAQVLSGIADEIPEIADQVSTLLDDVSDHGESAAAAIKFILFNVEALIAGFDILVRTVGPAADAIVDIGQAVGLIDSKPLDHVITRLDRTREAAESNVITQGKQLRSLDETGAGFVRMGGQADGAADSLGKVVTATDETGRGFSRASGEVEVWTTTTADLAAQAEDTQSAVDYMNRAVYNTADAADAANDAFERLFGEMMSLDEANLKVSEDFLNLGKTLRKNNGDLSTNTQEGINNRRMIEGMIGDLEAQREAAIAAGNGTVEATQKANAAYLAQLQKIRAVAAANGVNTAALDAMIAKYRELAALPAINKTATLTTRYVTTGDRAGSILGHGFERADAKRSGGIVGAAAGGMRSGLIRVGEEGEELVQLPSGSQVFPHGQSMRMMGGSGGGAAEGGGVLALVLAGDTDSAMAEMIQKLLNDGKIKIRQSAVVR